VWSAGEGRHSAGRGAERHQERVGARVDRTVGAAREAQMRLVADSCDYVEHTRLRLEGSADPS